MRTAVTLAAAAGIALAAAPAPARAAVQPRHSRVIFGSNVGAWAGFSNAVPLARSVRVYYDSTDPAKWPVTWPQRQVTASGRHAWMLLSIRPLPGPLLSGALDAQLRTLARSAPAHSMLTIWHEDAVGNNPLGYPAALRDPARYRAMQEHMETLVQGTKVRFGTIGCGPVSQAAQWYAPHLDWYGMDLYWNATRYGSPARVVRAAVWRRLAGDYAAFVKVSGERHPLLRIGESNAGWDSKRSAWFTDVAGWLSRHTYSSWLETFWVDGKTGRQGGLSGPWPPSAAVAAVLAHLSQEYQR